MCSVEIHNGASGNGQVTKGHYIATVLVRHVTALLHPKCTHCLNKKSSTLPFGEESFRKMSSLITGLVVDLRRHCVPVNAFPGATDRASALAHAEEGEYEFSHERTHICTTALQQ